MILSLGLNYRAFSLNMQGENYRNLNKALGSMDGKESAFIGQMRIVITGSSIKRMLLNLR